MCRMAHIWPTSSFPSFVRVNLGRPWSTYTCCMRCFTGAIAFLFLFLPCVHAFTWLLIFSLSLLNEPALMGMREICGLEKIAPFCFQERGCANYLGMKIKPLSTVILLYLRSSTSERHMDSQSCGSAPVIIVFWITQSFHAVPWKSYNSCSIALSLYGSPIMLRK